MFLFVWYERNFKKGINTLYPKEYSNCGHTGHNSAINIVALWCEIMGSKVEAHSVTKLDLI